ncbi:MAG TPA: alpha/beta hydrolase [Methylomirabilota bacterium]|nr:alpha/beta hydrolase [Methylomirabilota bacterium]
MDNPVVVRAVEVARETGLATLRFNFRGVGGSQGVHDQGRGEEDDVRAALAVLSSRLGRGAPVALAGHSFGAWVVARVAAATAEGPPLALIAPPLGMFTFDFLEGYPGGVLLVAGTRDEFCSTDDLGRLAKRLAAATTRVIEGGNHLFFGKLFALGEAVRDWIRSWAGSG